MEYMWNFIRKDIPTVLPLPTNGLLSVANFLPGATTARERKGPCMARVR